MDSTTRFSPGSGEAGRSWGSLERTSRKSNQLNGSRRWRAASPSVVANLPGLESAIHPRWTATARHCTHGDQTMLTHRQTALPSARWNRLVSIPALLLMPRPAWRISGHSDPVVWFSAGPLHSTWAPGNLSGLPFPSLRTRRLLLRILAP